MSCPPVSGVYPQASVSGLSDVQVDKHGINILRKTIEGYLNSFDNIIF